MTIDISTAADHDAAIAEKGVHHEQPSGTDWAAADTVEKGYPSTSVAGSTLEAYYPGDESSGTTANDVTGVTGDGTYSGVTLGQTGILGTTAPRYDGVDDYMSFPQAGIFDGAQDYSIVCWVNHDTLPSAGSGEKMGYVHPRAERDVTLWNFEGHVQFTWYDGANHRINSSALSTGTWYFVVAVWDATNNETRLYLDGTLEETGSTGTPNSTSNTNVIGWHATGQNYMDGRLDEPMVVADALTGSQVTELYEAAL